MCMFPGKWILILPFIVFLFFLSKIQLVWSLTLSILYHKIWKLNTKIFHLNPYIRKSRYLIIHSINLRRHIQCDTGRLIIKIIPNRCIHYYTKNQTKSSIQQYFIHMTSHHLIKNVYLCHKSEMVEFKFSTFCSICTEPRFLHNILIFKAIYLYIVDIKCTTILIQLNWATWRKDGKYKDLCYFRL